jgi:Domain of unknown function (DUF3850)
MVYTSFMNKIEKKIWPESFEAILNGTKTFELRLADWEINEGDILVMREWDPAAKGYTGREIEKIAGYIAKSKGLPYWKAEDIAEHGYQIISLL